MEYTKILMATVLFLSIFFSVLLNYYKKLKLSSIPVNLPILGMIPSVLLNVYRILDYSVEIMQQTQGTFLLKGPWLSKLEILLTADLANIHYIMCKSFADFNRGANFYQMFQILGEGILNSDYEKWKYQRKIAMSSFTSPRFRQLLVETLQHKLDKGISPILDLAHKDGVVVELEDLFSRLATDVIFKLLMGVDNNYLSTDPSNDSFDMMSTSHLAEDVVLARHVLPAHIWKLQKKLGIGNEGKLKILEEALDNFVYEALRMKREELVKKESQTMSWDLISLYMEEEYGADPDIGFKSSDVFLRDTFVNFLFAGKDTVSQVLSWLFWFLTKHPLVDEKIKEELLREKDCTDDISQLHNTNKLVYLHATIYETMRLYPPVPFVHRAANKDETLPSGHQVKPWTMIILNSYAMARLKCVWGEDCEEFKPERWITNQGTMKHEPAHKFFAFLAGPRQCLGKEMAMMQIKATVRHVLLHGYKFEVVEGHCVEPDSSIVLRMKHGVKVKVFKQVGYE